MKTIVSTLLLSTAAFLNFNELNAVKIEEESSSPPHGVAHGVPPGVPHKITLPYLNGKIIKGWIDPTRRFLVHAEFAENQFIPDEKYLRTNTVATLRDLSLNLPFVVYKHYDGRFLGVRAPNPRADLYDLEPNASTSFITYKGKNFEVKMHPPNGGPVVKISLMPEDFVTDANRHLLLSYKITMFGVKIVFYHTHSGKLVGAELDQ